MSISEKKFLECQKLFGKRLRKLRKEKEMSQLDLAALCDLDKTSISRIENGRTNVTLRTAVVLAEAMELEIKELYGFE